MSTTTSTKTSRKRPSTRAVVIVGLLVALLFAGVVSFYASGSPDGLEHVAESTGFADQAKEHATSNGPLADYGTKGVEDERLSVGAAGVIGTAVVLVLAGGLTLILRRRKMSSK